jgi:hypothetical protein
LNREHTVHDGHRAVRVTPATAIGAAGLAAGIMLAGGISTAPAPGPDAPGDVTASQPLPPAVTSARLASVDVPSPQPPTPGPLAIVITGNGPRAIIIGDPGGDGPGPKAVVIPGGGPLL